MFNINKNLFFTLRKSKMAKNMDCETRQPRFEASLGHFQFPFQKEYKTKQNKTSKHRAFTGHI